MHTNPAPVAVQAITTASYESWPSTCRPQGLNAEAVIDTLALSDIACPTWGLSNPFTTSCDGSTYLTATYGEPYNPVILVPTEILAIDPAWGSCTTNSADALLTLPCGIYDPPRALNTASALVSGGDKSFVAPTPEFAAADTLQQAHALVPNVTPVNSSPVPTAAVAAPANTGPASLPEPTSESSSANSAADLLKSDPSDPDTKQSNDPSQSNSVLQGASAPDLASESQNSGSNVQSAVPQAPTTINLGGGAASTQGVGAFINVALGGGSVPAPSPAFTPHAVTALGQILSITDPSAVAFAGSTLSVGGPAHVSDGKYYSLASSGNLVAGTLAASPEPSSLPVLSFAGSTYTANSASEFVLAGQKLSPGGQIMVSSTPVSLAPSANFAVIGTSTQVLATHAAVQKAALLTFAGSTYTANAASQFVVAGQTLPPGGQITVSGTPLSLAPSGDLAVIGTSTELLTTPAPTSNPDILTFAGFTYTANSASHFFIAGQTLAPGGTITASGTTISLPTGTDIAVIGTSTQTLATASPSTEEAPVLTWDGVTYTADASSDFIIASETLTPGGIITVLGTPISLAPGAADAVIGTSTQTLSSAVITPADIFTVAGQIVTANPTGFAIAGTTLLPGGKGVTVSGTPVSLGLGGTLDVGSGTLVLPTQGTGTGAAVFEGKQGRMASPGLVWLGLYTAFCTFVGAFVYI